MRQSVTFGVNKIGNALRQGAAQRVDVQLLIDLSDGILQPRDVRVSRFLPSLTGHTARQPEAYPRDGRFMQHHLLQMTWLHTGIVSVYRLEAVDSQSLLIAASYYPVALLSVAAAQHACVSRVISQ